MFLRWTNPSGSPALQILPTLKKGTSKATVLYKKQRQYWQLENDCLQQEDYFSGAVNLSGWCWAKDWLLSFIQTFSNMTWTIRRSKCKLSFMIFTLTILSKHVLPLYWERYKASWTMQEILFGASHLVLGYQISAVMSMGTPLHKEQVFELTFINCAIYWDSVWWSEVVDHWVCFTCTFSQRPDMIQIRIWEMLKSLED